MTITQWQDHIINTIESKKEDDCSEEKVEEKNWFDGIKDQIENIGQVCLAY